MIRLLKAIGIPNVVAHRLSDPVLNVVAILYGKMVKEREFEVLSQTNQNKAANDYLARQFKRLEKYARLGMIGHYNFLARKLLSSFAFQVQCYNSVAGNQLLLLRFFLVKSHLRYLRKLCHTRSTDLDYKRVWIDKKPGDFGRPLGVPTLVWRVYLRMLTNLGEIYVEGQGKYSNFQHGGRPGKGVQTCLIEMLELFRKFDRVYEFDLKGFFDHVARDSVKAFFTQTWISEVYSKLLYSKPRSYVLPPADKDIARNLFVERPKYKADDFEIEIFGLEDTTRVTATHRIHRFELQFSYNTKGTIRFEMEGKDLFGMVGSVANKIDYDHDIAPYTFLNSPDDFSYMIADYGDRVVVNIYHKDGWEVKFTMPELENKCTTFRFREESLDQVYKELMDTGMKRTINPFAKNFVDPTEEDRAKGRDNWKELDLAEQGIPQGSSFGPFLASTIAAHSLRNIKNLLMYVDDGMVFLKPGDASPEQEISQALKAIRVELAPEKSRIRERGSLLTEGIKFLGTRTFVKHFTTMRSETRAGVRKEFPITLDHDKLISLVDKMMAKGMLTKSKFKQLSWFVKYKKSRLKDILLGDHLHIAIKWNFFGNLLAEAYSPSTSPEDMKELIRLGMEESHARVLRADGSLGQMILGRKEWAFINSDNELDRAVPSLYNLSTLACDVLLELGVQGIMRHKRRAPVKERKQKPMYTATLGWEPVYMTKVEFLNELWELSGRRFK